jgi:hypothetical protein
MAARRVFEASRRTAALQDRPRASDLEGRMSIEAVMARIASLEGALTPAQSQASTPSPTSATAFASALQDQTTAGLPPATLGAQTLPATLGAQGLLGAAPMTGTTGTSAGLRALQLAQGELGVTEQPPGSNDAPRIAQYRQATAGSGVGPWCAYFVSWAAQQAGAPLGEAGQGFGSVAAVWDWAQRTGRAQPASAGPPNPGDLIVWGGQHIGIVESVDADGKIHTIEGNSSNMVTRRVHDSTGDGATGYVRLG